MPQLSLRILSKTSAGETTVGEIHLELRKVMFSSLSGRAIWAQPTRELSGHCSSSPCLIQKWSGLQSSMACSAGPRRPD
ncbi:hypothetical protein KSP39_PZI024218 [Platanthera zijinensis]|uniref:Uncharacterized protein n=1 Tax=Platanthera zijinensis TaxID=2320716 RepID=A0AAP0FSY9_9ASPA